MGLKMVLIYSKIMHMLLKMIKDFHCIHEAIVKPVTMLQYIQLQLRK